MTAAKPTKAAREIDKPAFSQDDIAHAMRFYGCTEQQAINGLLAQEANDARDDEEAHCNKLAGGR